MSAVVSPLDPAEGLLLATALREAFVKEAAPLGGLMSRFGALSRGKKALVGGGVAAGLGSALGGGMALYGARGIETRGGVLHFKAESDQQRFLSILKTQGKVAAARFALQMIQQGRASFTRKGGLAKTSASVGGAKSAITGWLDKGIGKLGPGQVVGLGALLAGGSALFGLGAEVVDRSFGGLEALKRHGDKPRTKAQVLQMVQRISSPAQLHQMGLAGRPTTSLGSVHPEQLKQLTEETAQARQRFEEAFDTVYRYAPLMVKDPLVTAMVLKEYAGTGQPMDPNQLKQLLELEQQMHRVKEMHPFQLRLAGKPGGEVLQKHLTSAILGSPES